MDRNFSRFVSNPGGGGASQDRQLSSFNYAAPANTPRATEWNFAPAPRQQQAQQPLPFDVYGSMGQVQQQTQQQHAHDAYGPPLSSLSQPPPVHPPASTAGPSRLSLAPQSAYGRQAREPRTINSADNYFKIRQNLHQGVSVNTHGHTPSTDTFRSASSVQYTPATSGFQSIPLNQYGSASTQRLIQSDTLYNPTSLLPPINTNSPAPVPQFGHSTYPSQSNEATLSPLSRIANGMLYNRQLEQIRAVRPEPDNIWQQSQGSILDRLQPQRQQTSPHFNPRAFQTPANRQTARSSSPPAEHVSSPTERVSLRRTVNRVPLYQDIVHSQNREETPQSQSSQQSQRSQTHSMPSASKPSKALTLSHAPPMAHGIQLISPYELPDRIRQVFPYELFNAVQSKCFQPIYHTNDNVVASAPTGSGKTALLELAICRLIEGHPSGNFKIVYQAPTKSLCSERLRDWERKFSHLNLPCAELTGDTSQKEMTKVRNASIIVTTPEKWDSITRKWTDLDRLVEMVKLFLIDEVHILKDTRGATLEAVVSRMKKKNPDVRFVALSATVPNSHDIAVWLGKSNSENHLPAHRETFGEDFRPVKLQKHVHGFDGSNRNDFIFEKMMDGKLPNLIKKYSQNKPIMVFCFTRKSCENTASILADWWTRQRVTDRAWPAPINPVQVESKQLRELVGSGVAFHHAGLDSSDRVAIESAYLKGDLNVICCTSTLAVGVNLPCHLVVLKGTVGYQEGTLTEYADLEVMQMLGRAGRPQFDDSAVAVIMTRHEKADRYKKMVSGQDILESTLHLNLIEHLNSEIGLRTIHNLNTAKEWLKGTFLSVRMRQNPNHYKMEGVPETRDTDYRLELVCERDIKLLRDAQLITDGDDFGCTEYGQAMSRYMVQFETMKLLLAIPEKAKTEEILHAICQAAEFKDLRIKPVERPHLREFNKSPFMKYPIKENISTTSHKIYLIVQIQLGGIEYPNDKNFNMLRRQFNIEKGIIFDRINRLIRCVIDCKLHDNDAVSTRNALDLARSLASEYWENSSLQLRQISGLGPAAVRKFANSGITSIEILASKNTADVERIMSRNPPYGRKLLDELKGFPRLKLSAGITKQTVRPKTNPKVNVLVTLSYQNTTIPVWKGRKPAIVFTAETSDGTLLTIWRGNVLRLEKKSGFEIRFSAELTGPDELITCQVACEDIVGTQRITIIKPALPASAFSSTPQNKEIVHQKQMSKTVDSDEFGSGDIDDSDLLEVADMVVTSPVSAKIYDADGFADIDDFEGNIPVKKTAKISTASTAPVPEPVKMANGKWTCNHACSGGILRKNGKPCKHKCCKEGLDKPRKLKAKAVATPQIEGDVEHELSVSEDGGYKKFSHGKNASRGKKTIPPTKTKTQKSTPSFMPKKMKEQDSDLDSVEVVDLAEDRPPTSYAQVGPRDYRKLHALHTSIQGNRSVNLPKRNPVPNSKGAQSYFQEHQATDDLFDDGGIDDDDFPSPSELFARSDPMEYSSRVELVKAVGFSDVPEVPEPGEEFEDAFVSHHAPDQQEASASSIYGDDMEDLEEDLQDVDYTTVLQQATSKFSKGNSSFDNGKANDLFDFDAFEIMSDSPIKPAGSSVLDNPLSESSSSSHNSRKREHSPSPKTTEQPSKRRQLLTETDGYRDEVNTADTSTIPSWVSEFDAELIDGLREYVEFVD